MYNNFVLIAGLLNKKVVVYAYTESIYWISSNHNATIIKVIYNNTFKYNGNICFNLFNMLTIFEHLFDIFPCGFFNVDV